MGNEFDEQGQMWDQWAPFYDSTGAAAYWDASDAAAFLCARAKEGPALELGVGTGRLALALAAQVPVIGVDASPRMLEILERKRGCLPVRTLLTDMAAPEAEGAFPLVYAAAGTLFCLLTQQRQRECFASVAELLEPEGSFVVEAAHPSHYTGSGRQVVVRDAGEDYLRLGSRRHDSARQRVDFHELHFACGAYHQLNAAIRYASAAELDLMAELAGLRLVGRFADWRQSPYTGAGHVSVYTAQ